MHNGRTFYIESLSRYRHSWQVSFFVLVIVVLVFVGQSNYRVNPRLVSDCPRARRRAREAHVEPSRLLACLLTEPLRE